MTRSYDSERSHRSAPGGSALLGFSFLAAAALPVLCPNHRARSSRIGPEDDGGELLNARHGTDENQWRPMMGRGEDDLKSTGPHGPWGFESLALRQQHHTIAFVWTMRCGLRFRPLLDLDAGKISGGPLMSVNVGENASPAPFVDQLPGGPGP